MAGAGTEARGASFARAVFCFSLPCCCKLFQSPLRSPVSTSKPEALPSFPDPSIYLNGRSTSFGLGADSLKLAGP